MQNIFLSTLAMLAFAANSILCRMALLGNDIDASSFTIIRIISGAVFLAILVSLQFASIKAVWRKTSWYFPVALSVYAIFFSYAYIALPATTGALILFTTVQITMMCYALYKGERFSAVQWLAYGLCVVGFCILLLPSAEAPDIMPAILMIVSGVAWGSYTLLAKSAKDPLLTVQQAFLWSVPLMLILLTLVLTIKPHSLQINQTGVVLAMLSGAFASGLGYFIWYKVLKKISTFSAAIAQLSVPIITAVIAVILLDEILSMQIYIAAILILMGLSINALQQK